VLFYKGLASNI